MPLRKHGTPEPIQPDQDRPQKEGSANKTFTEEDREALRRENAEADKPTTE